MLGSWLGLRAPTAAHLATDLALHVATASSEVTVVAAWPVSSASGHTIRRPRSIERRPAGHRPLCSKSDRSAKPEPLPTTPAPWRWVAGPAAGRAG